MSSPPLLYLGADDVLACGLDAADIAAAVAGAYRAKALGRARSGSRLSLPAGNGVRFTAKGGVLDEEGFAVVKWYGYVPNNRDKLGLPDFSPMLLLSSVATGIPLALIDGAWISAVRTAAISCVAARVLARPDSASLGLVACGTQAFAHLQALAAQFPLREVVAFSRHSESAQRLAAQARHMGLAARVASDAHDALAADIVVTSVPRESTPRAFLDARRVAAGTFVSMVCMGYSWDIGTLDAFDFTVTDDFDPHAPHTKRSAETLHFAGRFDADLETLLAAETGAAPRVAQKSRSAAVFAGSGLADTAAAVAVYRRAVQAGLGHWLPPAGRAAAHDASTFLDESIA